MKSEAVNQRTYNTRSKGQSQKSYSVILVTVKRSRTMLANRNYHVTMATISDVKLVTIHKSCRWTWQFEDLFFPSILRQSYIKLNIGHTTFNTTDNIWKPFINSFLHHSRIVFILSAQILLHLIRKFFKTLHAYFLLFGESHIIKAFWS